MGEICWHAGDKETHRDSSRSSSSSCFSFIFLASEWYRHVAALVGLVNFWKIYVWTMSSRCLALSKMLQVFVFVAFISKCVAFMLQCGL